MAIFLSFLFLLVSSVAACCLHESKVDLFAQDSILSSGGGSCGYGTMASEFDGGQLAAAAPSLYKDGAGCGACFKVRCKNPKLCSAGGTTVMVTHLNSKNQSDLLLNKNAFMAMANKGLGPELLQNGPVDVEYKRVSCQFKSKHMAVRVEESSKKPTYLAIKVLYQGGKTEIVAMDVAQVGTYNWSYLTRNHGAVWDTKKVPTGALQFRFVVTGGYDGKWIWAKHVLPANWKAGVVYDTGLQIDDVAQEGCFTCDDEHWN